MKKLKFVRKLLNNKITMQYLDLIKTAAKFKLKKHLKKLY